MNGSMIKINYACRNTTQTWEEVTKIPKDDDGHRWRKYGQKKINNSQYSRQVIIIIKNYLNIDYFLNLFSNNSKKKLFVTKNFSFSHPI
jgi:hypothetical protein